MTRSPQLRINDIVRASHKLQELTQDRSAFFDSEILQDAAAYNILIIGEAMLSPIRTLKGKWLSKT